MKAECTHEQLGSMNGADLHGMLAPKRPGPLIVLGVLDVLAHPWKVSKNSICPPPEECEFPWCLGKNSHIEFRMLGNKPIVIYNSITFKRPGESIWN